MLSSCCWALLIHISAEAIVLSRILYFELKCSHASNRRLEQILLRECQWHMFRIIFRFSAPSISMRYSVVVFVDEWLRLIRKQRIRVLSWETRSEISLGGARDVIFYYISLVYGIVLLHSKTYGPNRSATNKLCSDSLSTRDTLFCQCWEAKFLISCWQNVWEQEIRSICRV